METQELRELFGAAVQRAEWNVGFLPKPAEDEGNYLDKRLVYYAVLLKGPQSMPEPVVSKQSGYDRPCSVCGKLHIGDC